MIETFKKYRTPLSIVAAVIVAFAWYSMFYDGENGGGVLTSQDVSIQRGEDNELIVLLINLRSITLSESLFNDPAFKKLIDFGQQLVPEPMGRQNPFAPVGSDSI